MLLEDAGPPLEPTDVGQGFVTLGAGLVTFGDRGVDLGAPLLQVTLPGVADPVEDLHEQTTGGERDDELHEVFDGHVGVTSGARSCIAG